MNKSKGMKAASKFVGLLLCMLLMQTAFAAENQNQFTVNFTNQGNMSESPITMSPTIEQSTYVAGNATTENQKAGDSSTENQAIEVPPADKPVTGSTVVNKVSPSYYSTYLVAGSGTTLTVSFTNSGNDTLILNPKLVATPNSVNTINESWITLSPASATISPGSIQYFTIDINIPRDTSGGEYQSNIAFNDELIPNSTEYVNSLQLYISVQALPKLELQTTYISDTVEAGKQYEYAMKIKNVADEDITLDPKVNRYMYSSYNDFALSNDAIEISAPSIMRAGEIADLIIRVPVPENATGTYNGYIEMNVDGKANDGSVPQIGLYFTARQQPVVPYVKTFSTTNSDQITIEVSADTYSSDMGLRTSPKKEDPSFELNLTYNSNPVDMTLVKTTQNINVYTGGYYYPVWVIDNSSIYQNNGKHYVETYTVPGAIGDWELTILPKNTESFGCAVTVGDPI